MVSPREAFHSIRNHPKGVLRDVNRLYHSRLKLHDENPSGIDIIAADWDNLIILDACRYNVFEKLANLPGTLEKRRSKGACTPEWLSANFKDRKLHDIVYVTSNPQYAKREAELDADFHDVINVWQETGWHEELNTVQPSTITSYARAAAERYPDKRLLVHFLQPHHPFLTTESSFDKDERGDGDPLWERVFRGELDISAERVQELYEMNLRETLPYVDLLLHKLEGKTVVSSDHGNVYDEPSFPIPIREWGHPKGIYTPQLVEVPWHVYQNGSRKQITKGEPVAQMSNSGEEILNERLKQLGYAPE